MLGELEVKLQLGLEQLAAIDNRTKAIKRLVKGVSEDTEASLGVLSGDKDEEDILSVQEIFDQMDQLLEKHRTVIDKVETLDTRVFEMKEEAESTFKLSFWSFVICLMLLLGSIINTGIMTLLLVR